MDLLPLIALVAFFSLALLFRVAVQLRRHGGTGIALFRGPPREWLADTVFLVVPIGLLLAALSWARAPGIRPPLLTALGLLGVVAGVSVILKAQLEMGASWRIGIDPVARPGLVTHGLYALSRNPIYLGLLLGLAGMVALLPMPATLAMAVVAAAIVRLQVGREERYLRDTYGDEFAAYAARVGRFLPGLGRIDQPR